MWLVLQVRQWLADETEHPLGKDVPENTAEVNKELKHIDFQLTVGKFLDIFNFEEFQKTHVTALTKEPQVFNI